MVAIGSIGTWTPGSGPVITWTASTTASRAAAAAPADALPATFQQVGHLHAASYGRQLGRQMPRLMVVAWDIPGSCDVPAMTEAINTHVRRHDTYHSAFDVKDGVITRQTLADPESIEFTPALVGEMGPEQIREHVLTTTPGTLDWDCFSFGVIQKADHFSVYASIDHLHIDLLSSGIIFLDIHLTYAGLTSGQTVELPPVNGYRDYNTRQQAKVASMTLESKGDPGLDRLRPRRRRPVAELPAVAGRERQQHGRQLRHRGTARRPADRGIRHRLPFGRRPFQRWRDGLYRSGRASTHRH